MVQDAANVIPGSSDPGSFFCAIITLSLLPGGSDAQILVRDLDDVLVERLKRQASATPIVAGEVKAF